MSAFTIDPEDPTELSPLGPPVYTMGKYPVSVAYSSKHHVTCVINSGDAANLACFSVSDDGLCPLRDTVRSLGLTQTNPPTGPPMTPSEVLFNQEQSQLLVSIKGNATAPSIAGSIDTFLVECSEPFTLAECPVKSSPKDGLLTFSMTLAGNDVVFNTDPAFGVCVSKFDDKGAIVASSNTTIVGQLGTCWSSHSPRTGSFYVTDGGQPLVTELTVDYLGPVATIIASHKFEGTLGRTDQAVGSTKNGDFLYILGGKAGLVDVIALSGPGEADEIQSFNLQSVVPDIPISVQGMAVYAK